MKINESEDVPIWAALDELRRTETTSVLLERDCDWETLRSSSIDVFRHRLDKSGEYAAFFVRALIGEEKHSFQWSQSYITVDLPTLNYFATADLNRRLGADLVARAALTAAWEICQRSSHCSYFPCLDQPHLNHPALEHNKAGILRFLSADFVRAVKKSIEVYSTPEEATTIYYDFGWVDGKPPTNENWTSHGWRMEGDRAFGNSPPNANEETIETFLEFPAFFQHEVANITFCFPLELDWRASISNRFCALKDDSLKELLRLGIGPYISEKQKEFETRQNCNPKIVGSISSCVGVASHHAAFFDPKKFQAGYGVFLTVDVEATAGERSCGSDDCRLAPKEHLKGIQEALEDSRHRLRYKVLQVLAATLANETERKTLELEKYESMYHQLLRPLRNMTEAIRQSQADAHEIAAIIYDPMEVLLGCQPEIAQLYEENNYVRVPGRKKVRVRHQPRDYTNAEDACGIAAELLRRLVPESTSRNGQNVRSPIEAFTKAIDWYSSEAENVEASYYFFSLALSRFIGNNDWDARKTSAESNPIDAAKDILNSLKLRLFTLYKPDEANNELLWEVMRAYLATIKCDDDLLNPPQFAAGDPVLQKGTNPFSSHGHVVCFIGRVVAQHCSYHRSLNLTFNLDATTTGTSILTIESTKEWIANDEIGAFGAFLKAQISFSRQGVKAVQEFGDRKRPFVGLIERIPKTTLDDENSTNSEASGGKLKISVGSLSFSFGGRKFVIESRIVGAKS